MALLGSHPCMGRGWTVDRVGRAKEQPRKAASLSKKAAGLRGRLPAFPRRLLGSEVLRLRQMGQSPGPDLKCCDRTPGSVKGEYAKGDYADSEQPCGRWLCHQGELWFLSPSTVQVISLAPASSAPGLLGGRCLCHENMEDPGDTGVR